MKYKLITLLCLTIMMFTACGHEHTFIEATCTAPKTCSECNTTEGEPLDHTFTEATCTAPKTCSVCNTTEGEPLGHTFTEATCETPMTCSVCEETQGEPLEHTWIAATCITPKTCSVCKTSKGLRASHTWIDATYEEPQTCTVCSLTKGEPKVRYAYSEIDLKEAIKPNGDGTYTYSKEFIDAVKTYAYFEGATNKEIRAFLDEEAYMILRNVDYMPDDTLHNRFTRLEEEKGRLHVNTTPNTQGTSNNTGSTPQVNPEPQPPSSEVIDNGWDSLIINPDGTRTSPDGSFTLDDPSTFGGGEHIIPEGFTGINAGG